MARFGALQIGVIALYSEYALTVEPCFLELPVHVGSNHEPLFPLYRLQQQTVQLRACFIVSVQPDMACPICPPFLFRLERIKRGGVHIRKTVSSDKVPEVVLETASAIFQSCGSGKSGSRSDNDILRPVERMAQFRQTIGITLPNRHFTTIGFYKWISHHL